MFESIKSSWGHLVDYFCPDCNLSFGDVLENPLFLGFIIVAGLIILWGIYSRLNRIVLIDENNRGKIFLKRSELFRMIRQECVDILPNAKPEISIKNDGKSLHILIKLRYIYNVRAICPTLQESIYQALIERTGVSVVGSVNIIVTKLIVDVLTAHEEEELCQSLPSKEEPSLAVPESDSEISEN